MMIAAGAVMFVRGAFDALENGVDWDNLILMVGGLTLIFVGFMAVASWTVSAIVLLIGGIAMLVIGIMDWIKQGELSTQTFWLLEAAIVAIGVALAMLLGWPVLVVAAVIAIALAIYKYWDEIKAFLVGLWESIKVIFGVVANWFKEKVIDPVVRLFEGMFGPIFAIFSNIWEDVKEVWGKAKDWFSDTVLDPIKDTFTSVWEGISDTIKGVINGIIGFINGMIRGIVDGINAVIGLLNKLNFKIPDWVPGLGGETFGFNIATMTAPQIPMLATGAVIPANAPFAAILGDQKHGTNIEAPESLLRDLIREELGRNQSRQDTIHNVIKLDGQVLYEAVKKIDKRVGTSLISGSGIR
jgi:hypothetical protein